MLEDSILSFAEALASRAPAPGGGGASALAGAIGIALGSMVGSLTVGKKKYASVEDEIIRLNDAAQELRLKLLACIEEDAAAFLPLSRAYQIPRDDPGRDEILQTCLQEAARVPLKILQYSCDAIELLKQYARAGSVLAISDSAAGAAICKGALYGAAVNVRVNTAAMKDRELAERIDAEVGQKTAVYSAMADEIYEDVIGRIS